jgi:acetyl esterase/lipase
LPETHQWLLADDDAGSLNSEDPLCAQTAIKTGALVLNVNYRHTPGHTFPTAWHDSQDAFVWLHKNIDALGGDPAQVVVGGVSAGGNLPSPWNSILGRAKPLRVCLP